MSENTLVLVTGMKLGRVTLIEKADPILVGTIKRPYASWLVKCDCGNEKVMRVDKLRHGKTPSCGCLNLTEDLTGRKFGKLTVLKRGPIIPDGKRTRGTWECQCDCGSPPKNIKEQFLKAGSCISCGCWASLDKAGIKPGDKFHRLTVVSFAETKLRKDGQTRSYWNVICECGKTNVISSDNLGNVISCGCRRVESAHEMWPKGVIANKKYTPAEASKRFLWNSLKSQKRKKCDLSFEDFDRLTNMNCHYCDVKPSQKVNAFTFIKRKNENIENLRDGTIFWNGLDRVDTSKHYYLENVVTCCGICNVAKSDLTVERFLELAEKWKNIKLPFTSIQIGKKDLPEHNGYNAAKAMSIKKIFGFNNNRYADGNLTIEEFYWIASQPCFYCGIESSNYHKISGKKLSEAYQKDSVWICNGADRIDSSQPHNRDNVVPACKYCNRAKKNMSLEKFQELGARISAHQQSLKSLKTKLADLSPPISSVITEVQDDLMD